MTRYVWQIGPMAQMNADDVVTLVASTVQRHLTRPLPAGRNGQGDMMPKPVLHADPRPDDDEMWTPSGVRLRRRSAGPGPRNWLLLPGGPGLGSESLADLADLMDVAGDVWLVDLPGDGSNIDPPGAGLDPYRQWPVVLLEAAQAVSDPVLLGHSTGGMYVLSVPELEPLLRGVVLVSSAPDSGWMPAYLAMTNAHPLPGVVAATEQFEADPTNAHLRDVAVASAPWNFDPQTVDVGAEMLGRMPYNMEATNWSARNFDNDYIASWWPETTPTLILSGSDDRIVDQRMWHGAAFQGRNVVQEVVPGGQHFPWIEQPDCVARALHSFDLSLDS